MKQKNAPSGARQVKCPADSKTGAFAPYKHFAPAKSWRRANSLRPSILNYPWVEPPAAAKPKKKRQPTVVSSFLVDLKGFEPTTLRMRTVRSPKRCSSMHHKPHRKLPTIIRYCRRKAKKVYGLVQFFTVQAKKQASCDNQAIFPYYTPPICEMSTQWRRYSSHRGKGMLKNEDFGRYVRIQKHARQSVLFYYHRR